MQDKFETEHRAYQKLYTDVYGPTDTWDGEPDWDHVGILQTALQGLSRTNSEEES